MKESTKILRIRGSKFEIHIGAKVKIKVRAKEYSRRLSREKSERKKKREKSIIRVTDVTERWIKFRVGYRADVKRVKHNVQITISWLRPVPKFSQ